ncbi:hypothetical protein C8J30_11479 [Rhodobacter viridis]|uniref:Uncharacterized protein n=1 Tax=Rhodobacter viridis TaxID=1054202 RepID=A0A318TTG0_9RHOB|nr:hypothetical protein [Rhodobacter viridis]PYF08141.1 hypothetical protein C8J30_11479 [Rhodobacter viridis]
MKPPHFLKALLGRKSAEKKAIRPQSGPLAPFFDALGDPSLPPTARDGIGRIFDAVESPMFLSFPKQPALPKGVVPVADLPRALALMVSREGLETLECSYFPGVLPELSKTLLSTLDGDTQQALTLHTSRIQDRLSAALFSLIDPALARLTRRLPAETGPCPPLDSLRNASNASVLELLQLAVIVPLDEVPVALAMLEIFEAGAIPCGYLGLDAPCDTAAGRLCAWIGPQVHHPEAAAPAIELEDQIGRAAQEIFFALREAVRDLEVVQVGETAFVSSKSAGFFLSSGPMGAGMDRYTVYLSPTEEYDAATRPLAARIAGLAGLADCTARFGAPEKDIPSIRLPGRPPTLPGKLYRHGQVRVSALSANGVDLAAITVWLDPGAGG